MILTLDSESIVRFLSEEGELRLNLKILAVGLLDYCKIQMKKSKGEKLVSSSLRNECLYEQKLSFKKHNFTKFNIDA
jgi:hypothetical protein